MWLAWGGSCETALALAAALPWRFICFFLPASRIVGTMHISPDTRALPLAIR
jgi:hypothetical protein